MKDDSALANDLESLKIAAREARHHRSQLGSINRKANRTDLVHAGYRILQCVAAGIIFTLHITVDFAMKIAEVRSMTYVIIYPVCFVASLILAICRLMSFIPNPPPIIPVAISVTGWAAMLSGAIMAMRNTQLKLDIATLTDDELSVHPIFQHDLTMCAVSLVGSSLYLVHAWLCYDCWRWERRVKKLREAENSGQQSSSSAEPEPDSETSSNDESESDGSALALPGPSGGQGRSGHDGFRKSSRRTSKLLSKLRGTPERSQQIDFFDPIATLNEVLRSTVQVEQVSSIQPTMGFLKRMFGPTVDK